MSNYIDIVSHGKQLRLPKPSRLNGCREAGSLLHAEAYRRGYAQAEKVVYLGDGAPWVWENARLNFLGAEEILDFYHAAGHVGELAELLWEKDNKKAEEYRRRWCKKLKESTAQPIIKSARRLFKERHKSTRETVETAITCFKTNADRMRYGEYQAQGYFIGSGVIEAGCKTVIGSRMKRSGMFWSDQGAENILGLRCLLMGPHFDQSWNARREILTQQRRKARRWNPENN